MSLWWPAGNRHCPALSGRVGSRRRYYHVVVNWTKVTGCHTAPHSVAVATLPLSTSSEATFEATGYPPVRKHTLQALGHCWRLRAEDNAQLSSLSSPRLGW